MVAASPISSSSSPGCYAFNTLLANVPGKAIEEDPSIWAPATHIGDSDEVSVSWVWPSPAPAVADS